MPDSNSKFAKGLDLELPSDTASPAVVRTEPWRCSLEVTVTPGKVTRNGKMEVWKMMFLFNWMSF